MFDKYEYDQKYIKEHYCRISLALPKEYRNLVQSAAKERGVSVTAYVRKAIDKELERG